MTHLQRSAWPTTLCIAVTLAASCADLIAPIDPVVATCSADNESCPVGFLCTDGLCLRSTVARCGDGEVQDETSEECDDGNDDPNDRCDNCRVTYCGDGIAQHSVGEECDDGNRITTDACTADCAWARCGDGITRSDSRPGNPNHEDCDDANTDDRDRCSNDCLAARCGDGWVLEGVEPCDDGNNIDDDDCSNTCGLGYVDVALSYDTGCALTELGSVNCWGAVGHQDTRFTPGAIGLSEVERLVPGDWDLCALKRDKSLWCWSAALGYEPVRYGDDQSWTHAVILGNPTHVSRAREPQIFALNDAGALFRLEPGRAEPVNVPEALTSLSASLSHACGLSERGWVYCFGANESGQLGLGMLSDRVDQPTRVDLAAITSVAAFQKNTCATDRDGGLFCWGYQTFFSGGDEGHRSTPSAMANLPPIASVVANGNLVLRLGDGTAHMFEKPRWRASENLVPIIPASAPPSYALPVALAAPGENFCAVNPERRLACWGDNRTGLLGLGSPHRAQPMQVPNLPPAQTVASGYSHSCALLRDGSVRCWGENDEGQRNDGAGHEFSAPPTLVPGLSRIQQLQSGSFITCVLGQDQTGTCWPDDTEWHTIALGERPWATLSVGNSFLCALDLDGHVHCAGHNMAGELGDGTQNYRPTLEPVQGLGRVDSIELGNRHACARDTDGLVWCWGSNFWGGCGTVPIGDSDQDVVLLPQRIEGLGATKAISAGTSQTCVITEADQVVCWGSSMRLGMEPSDDNPNNIQRRPVQRLEGRPVAIEAFNSTVCIVIADGSVQCFGSNAYDVLGDSDPANTGSVYPKRVQGLPPIQQMNGGDSHACAVSRDGVVYCWGSNVYNQLGTGVSAHRYILTELPLF